MSLVNLANTCAHLQNCTMAKLPLAKIPYTRLHLQIAVELYKEGFIGSIQRGSISGPDLTPVDVTHDNISTRRIWLGLKYNQNSNPVLKNLHLISKPSRKVYCTIDELKNFAIGKRLRFIKPPQPGEVIFVRTKKNEILNLHEAIKKNLDAELLCRVS
ncbi:hypothetical protein CANARDRAFT_29975 [[Candida] arabinofermentans NRRL YB-2248]|uniref:Ribosomal protein S8 n=1 Tax=[Candida] arabinofermentans NRRL YB-2248 TaxID=983967 RepID=A0A1E4SVP4_9ASCO|nr:hypothetical protein CANARDRAFT_29975 [[Candida] arabinofermentans NRRL YB-2248]